MARTSVPDFQTANPLYAGSSVTFFTVDVNGVKTVTKASLFDSPVAGGALANPQTLDSDGKFAAPVYIEEAVIMSIAGVHVADHDTGVIAVPGTWRGDWVTATVFFPGDTVRDGTNGDNTQNLYRVISAHTSGVWATDKADSTKLVLAVSVSDIVASEAAAAASASAAATSETNAATSETNAATSETNAASSASAAATSETNAATSETNAASSASAASTAQTNAETAETNAETAETNAATSETNAATSETNAAASATTAESAAQAVAERYDFDTSTAMADPGTGDIRYNNATVSSVTQIAVAANTAGAGNPDISARIVTWDDSTNSALRGTLVIRKGGTPATFAVFSITGPITDNGTWLQIPVAHVASAGAWSASDDMFVGFSRTGNKGADGAGSGDVIGPGSATDNAIARFDGTTGELIQDSGVTVDDDDNLFGHGAKINAQTGTTYTLTASDNGKVVTLDNASAITLTFPQTSTESLAAGFQAVLIAKGAGQVTVAKEGSDTILSKDSNLKLTKQASVATVIKLAAGSPNAWFLGGDLAA